MRCLPALLALLVASAAAAQPALDAPPPVLPDSADTRTPRGAVVRALVLPGLGQVYNRQYVKAPLMAAGVAGAVAYAVWRQRRYTYYRRAALYAGCLQGPNETPERIELCTETAPGYEDEWQDLGEPAFATIAPVRNSARGQRDIAVLVVGVAYAFQVLDAYVAAELAAFDVSEDVVVHVRPDVEGPVLALRVRL